MLEIKIWRNPYDTGVNLTTPKTITFEEGITVLVGCNGAGKTTLLLNIEEYCRQHKIPRHLYDNLRDGGNHSIGSILAGYGEADDDVSVGVSLWTSSEGEAIKLNIGRDSRLYKEFFHSGHYKNRDYKMARILKDKEDAVTDNKRVLLFDAADSGLSIDSVIEIKDLFSSMIKDAKEIGIELYIIISANEYELARGERCLNVNTGKYHTFPTYDDYRDFIIKNRKWKDNRIEREAICFQKKKEKEVARRKAAEEKYLPLIESIETKAREENRSLTWSERNKIDNYKRIIEGRD